MAEVSVLILAKDDADLEKVKTALESLGLTKVSTLPRLRILKGFVDEARLGKLSSVPGVSSVEKEREIQLPPPGSRTQ